MTEKQYGGASSHNVKELKHSHLKKDLASENHSKKEKEIKKDDEIENENLYIKAGEIAKQAKEYAKSIVFPNIPLLEIAEKIELKIVELGGFPAFPVNLSKNEIAAHSTPLYNDIETASGLLKVDIGVHIEGCIADTALSLDLENSEENKELIDCAETCLKKALEEVNYNSELRSIGKAIEKTAHSKSCLLYTSPSPRD